MIAAATALAALDTVTDGPSAAAAAGLVYVHDTDPGLSRRKAGTGFSYRDAGGHTVRDAKTLARIRALAIPPAYRDVWICADLNGHIQATGNDDRGRKQYRYHAGWSQARDATKFHHMMDFAAALPDLRSRIEADMRRHGLPREKVLATVVDLLEKTSIRVGNEDYARANKSYGLTTLRSRHVAVDGGALRFEFKGKSGKLWRLRLADRRVARIVKACQDLPGQHLFQYVDPDGARHAVSSDDVNAYLREATGRHITAKDFRTWAGTVLAAMALTEFERVDSAARAKKNVRAAIEKVAGHLGNTPTVCRKCYIHPEVLTAYLDGDFLKEVSETVDADLESAARGFRAEEAAVLGLLKRRLNVERQRAA